MISLLLKNKKFSFVFLFLSICFLVFSISNSFSKPNEKEVPLADLVSQIKDEGDSAKIKEVQLDDAHRSVTLVFKDKEKKLETSSYPTDYGVTILEAAETTDTKVDVSNNFAQPRTIFDVILSLLPLLLIGALIFWMISSSSGGRRKKAITEIPDTRFTDLAGIDEALEDMAEITEFLKDTDKFREIGAVAPKGALLFGPPGTGKTALARAVAGEAGVPFIYTTGSDFAEMFVGMGARRVRNLFKEARKHDRCIVFIDEIDSVGGKRGGGQEGPDSREHGRTINALLAEMDGFEKSNIIVLAATNSPDSLDPALTRAGRFDRKITVDLPDWKGRKGILEIHSRNKPLGEDVDLETLAKTTTGLSGAELANLVNEALINAVRNDRKTASQEDFMEALSVVTLGRARHSAVMTDFDRTVTAWHESGHAVVSLALEEIPDPSHVTIIPRGVSGGHTKLQEPEDKFQTSKALKGRLAMMMGGLAAERLFLGDITQGPGSDLQVATNLAQNMVAKMGMGTSLSVVADQSIMVNAAVSEDVRRETEKLISEAVLRAEAVLADPKWRRVFDAMGTRLLEVDTLETDEIQVFKAMSLDPLSKE